jgi:hypothetical protein
MESGSWIRYACRRWSFDAGGDDEVPEESAGGVVERDLVSMQGGGPEK